MAVNLYFDSKEVLRSLKGVGDKTADKIINLRRKGVDLTVERLAKATSISVEQWEEYLSEGLIILDKGAAMMTNLKEFLLDMKQSIIEGVKEVVAEKKLQEVLDEHKELYWKKKKEWFRKGNMREGKWSYFHPSEWDGYRCLDRKPCYVSQLWKEVKGLYMVIFHAEQKALAEVSKASQSVRSRISEICSESYSIVEGELHEIASHMVYYRSCNDCLDTLIGAKERISGWDKSSRCAECQNKGQNCLETIQLGSIEGVGTQTEVQSRTSEQSTLLEVESVEEVGTQTEVQSRTSEQGTQVEVESVSRTVSSTQTTFIETKGQGTETSCEPERVDLGTQTLQETVDRAVEIVSTTMVQGVQTLEGSVQSDSITVGKDQLGMFETSSTVVSSSLGDLGVDQENLRYVTTVKLDSDQPVIEEVCRPDLIESVLLSSPKASTAPIVSEGSLKPSSEILQELSCMQEISPSEPLQVSPSGLMGELVTTIRVTEELVETSSKLDPALKDHSLLSYQDFRDNLHSSQDFPDIVEQLSFDMSNLHLETSSESNCVGLNC